MNEELISALRYKLNRRISRLKETDYALFHFSLKQFWNYLQKSTVLSGIIDDLKRRYPQISEEIVPLFSKNLYKNGLLWDDEEKQAAVSIYIIEKCINSNDQKIEINIGLKYSDEQNYNRILESFNSIFLDAIYYYIDEKLDDQRLILGILKKYKQKCEWFQRDTLYNSCIHNLSKGEYSLANNLYEYLHDQGIQFFIDPQSASGKADFVSIQSGEEPIIADAKIFWPEKSKGVNYICKGFNQIYLYTVDYNEPFGYLVIFNMAGKDLKFSFANYSLNFPFIVHNAKTIYFITINIYLHETSASKRGQTKSYIIYEKDLIEEINNKKQFNDKIV